METKIEDGEVTITVDNTEYVLLISAVQNALLTVASSEASLSLNAAIILTNFLRLSFDNGHGIDIGFSAENAEYFIGPLRAEGERQVYPLSETAFTMAEDLRVEVGVFTTGLVIPESIPENFN